MTSCDTYGITNYTNTTPLVVVTWRLNSPGDWILGTTTLWPWDVSLCSAEETGKLELEVLEGLLLYWQHRVTYGITNRAHYYTNTTPLVVVTWWLHYGHHKPVTMGRLDLFCWGNGEIRTSSFRSFTAVLARRCWCAWNWIMTVNDMAQFLLEQMAT